MDARQFDRLTQQLGIALSRRRFGVALAALGLGAGGAAPPAKARKKKKKKKLKPCAAGATRCGTACVDTQSNAQHCGGCDRPCAGARSCSGGQCQAGDCQGNQVRCGGACVNPDTDEQHCGECGNQCAGDLTCLDGDCGCAAGTRCGNACVDLDDDDGHCGECGRACNGDLACLNGQCGCAAGTRCGNQCVNVNTSSAHCGECDNTCTGALTCIAGVCGCASGTRCGNDCVNTQSDRRHCGGCDDACTGNQVCSGGECVEPPECVDQYGCGGYSSWNDLACVNGRCVCANADEGLCQRYSDRSGRCDKCCPGGSGQCRFDEICFYDPDFEYGPLAYCDCPRGWQRCNYNPHPTGTCVQHPQTDSRKCGQFCEDCTANTEFPAICCGGLCTRGCGGPGTVCFNQGQPCGPNCLPCNSDSICCNMGPRSLPRCIPNVNNSNVCYLN